MKRSIIFLSLIVLVFTTPPTYADLLINCQNGGSASLGDLKQQVRLSCGEPDSTEVIGYIDKVQDKYRIRVMKIEEWIYAVPFYGVKYFYSLVFEGNKLVEITNAGKK